MQKKNQKQTSERVARIASKVLTDNRYGAKSKSLAGSALSQARQKKSK